MIYDQQKAVGLQLHHIDEKVRDLRKQFTNILYQTNPGITQDEIDKIFKRFDNYEITKAIKDMQQKHESV
jgi:hypothetical protein